MSGPAWLAGSFAVLMVVIAAYCACRLAVARLRGRNTEIDTDGLHVLMGVAMAGMLEPRLTPVPAMAWRVVFAAAAAWFAWQAIRPDGRAAPDGRAGRSRARCAHPAPHAVECAVMVYMLLPVGSWPGATAGNPALTLVLALFMLGYVLWATDRLAGLSRVGAAVPALAPRLAASYKVAMGIAMGYMLVTML